MIGAAAGVAAGLGLSLLAGAALLAALDRDGRLTDTLPLRLGLSWGLGAALTAWSVWLLGWAGLPLSVPSLGGTLVAASALALLLARRARVPAPVDPAAPAARSPRAAEGPSARLAFVLLLAALAAAALVTAALSVRAGAHASDAHSIWLLKARVVALDGGFDGPYWRDWPDGHDRRGYPPLVSLLGAWVHLLAGRVDDGLVKLAFASFHVALLALVYDVLARHLARWMAVLATLVFALTGMTIVLTVWGVADLPLAFYLLAALHALRLDARGGAVAGVLLAAAAFTKLEGAVAALLVAALAAGGTRRALRLVAPPAAVVLLWLLFLRPRGIPLLVGPGAEFDAAAGFGARLAVATSGLVASALRPGWLWVWPLFVVALALLAAGRAPLASGRWAAVVLALLAADALVLGLQAGNLPWLVGATGPRLLYHVYPAAYAVTVLALAAPPAPAGPGVSRPARTSRGPAA